MARGECWVSAPTYILLGDRVVFQHQVRQPGECAQGVQVGQLDQVVGFELQVRQVGDGVGQRRLNGADSVAREEESLYARRQREVGQRLDVVVDEVYGILRLRGPSVRVGVWGGEGRRARARPPVTRAQGRGKGEGERGNTYACHAQVLNGGDSVTCSSGARKNGYQLCLVPVLGCIDQQRVAPALFTTYLGDRARAPSAR